MREFVNIPPPGIELQIAEGIAQVLVDEQGYPDNEKTLGQATLIRLFARLVASTRPFIAKKEHNPAEEVWRRAMISPKPLAFWINTLVGARGREKHIADRRYIHGRRLEGDFRFTVFDQ